MFGLIIPSGAEIHRRHETPVRAITIQAALSSLLVLAGTFSTIISYFVFVVVIFIGLTVAALFLLRRRYAASLTYRTPGYPVTPIIFLVLIALLLFLLGANNPLEALLGVGVVILGLPVYYLLLRGENQSVIRRNADGGTTSV